MSGFISFVLRAGPVPVVLAIAAAALIRARGDRETVGRRMFRFAAWTSIGLLASIFLSPWLLSWPTDPIVSFLGPVTAGLIALSILHVREWRSLRDREKALISLAVILLTALAGAQLWAEVAEGNWRQSEFIYFVLPMLLTSALLTTTGAVMRRHPAALVGVAVLYLTAFHALELVSLPLPAESRPALQSLAGMLAFFTLPGLLIGAAAALCQSGLRGLPTRDPNLSPWWPAIGRLALAGLLVGGLVYTCRWAWIWDSTDDGVRAYLLLMVSGVTAAAAGLVLAITAVGWRRWVGLAFPVLVLAALFGTTRSLMSGPAAPHHRVTEARAARIAEAIERFQAQNGRYPVGLTALVPGEIWRIPKPIIVQGQGWCYESGPDHYRLGTVFREHWSSPIFSVRVYASAGDVRATDGACDETLAEVRSQYDLAFNAPPTPVPLPTSAVSVPRTVVEPVFQAASLSVGRWSPDGAYLVFGPTEYYGELGGQVEIDLHFLRATTGEVCRAGDGTWRAGLGSDGLREHHAWLPDGRLLYVSEAGEMVAYTPCEEGAEMLADRYPVTFTHAVASDDAGRILLKNANSYWILDGASLAARAVPAVSPVSGDRAWAAAAWAPGGERLAITQMEEPGAGATLYVVEGMTGALAWSLELADASDANPPFIEWLAGDQLLVHGSRLDLLDLSADPPQTIDPIREVFLLDLEYPADVWAMASVPDPAGHGFHIGVRVNHPHNQGAYLYTSETGQVTVYEHEAHILLFFPGGGWMSLPSWEDYPSYRDEYELVWPDQPAGSQRLVVEGHTPREHPQMFPAYLPSASQLAFSSSQGISLVAVPDGETVAFWELAGKAGGSHRALPSPGGEALVVAADGAGLYYLPLPPDA